MATTTKKQIPRFETLTPRRQRDLHHTLALTLLRPHTAGLHAQTHAPTVVETLPSSLDILRDVVRVRPSPGVQGTMAAWLYLATMEIVIAFWHNYGFSDPEVDELIKSETNRNVLHDFRNKVFHATPLSDRAYRELFDKWNEVVPWAAEVEDAMTDYVRAWLKVFLAQPK